jgi:hypothetical protein
MIYDVRGRRVEMLADESYPAGTHSIIWNPKSAASGVYYCQIQAGDFVDTKRMALIK